MAKKRLGESVGLRTLKNQLKNNALGTLYFFYGEERYLQEYYLGQLRKKLVVGPAAEFNEHRLTAETMTVDAFSNAVEAVPMLAERSLVRVDDYDLFGQSEEDRKRLTEILSDIPSYCCVVFYYDTAPFSPDKRKKKLVDAISGGVLVEFLQQRDSELSVWIARHFSAQGKRSSTALCQYLSFLTGGSMTRLSAEIGKISAYASGVEITRQDIDAVTEKTLAAISFDITDALAVGDYDLALGRLFEVLQRQEESIVILGAIGAHIRRLNTVKTLLAAGKHANEIRTLTGMNDYVLQKTIELAGKVSARYCDAAVTYCYEADKKLKSTSGDDGRILELLIAALAGEEQG